MTRINRMGKWGKDLPFKFLKPPKKGLKYVEYIEISEKLYHKIYGLTVLAEGEISGFGKTEKRDNTIVVTDLKIFPQVCTSAHTTLSGEALTEMYVKLVQEGENPKNWNFWWHSHVDMDTYFSNIDVDTLEKLSKNDGRIVALCTNRHGEYATTIYKNSKPVKEGIPLKIIPDVPSSIVSELEKEILINVKFEDYINVKGRTSPKIYETDGPDRYYQTL